MNLLLDRKYMMNPRWSEESQDLSSETSEDSNL